MKYLQIILAVIALALIFIAWKLIAFEEILNTSNQNMRSIVGSSQALINSNQRLETSFESLRQEVSDFKTRLPKN